MTIHRTRAFRTGTSFVALAGVLALSLTAPIPSFPDDARTSVMGVVHERLPGWTIERVDRTWEGAFTVVTTCADRQIGFQYRPGHGMSPQDAWLQPDDPYARQRLATISDHWRHLVWYSEPAIVDSLSCQEELAGGTETALVRREFH
ncbi:MAG: hypothetical protein ACRDGH_05705 [Candidatus Limnocylindria bacterium]